MIRKSLILSTVGLLPFASNVFTAATTNVQAVQLNEATEEQEPEACTFMYVGKNVSTNGKAIIARSGDSSPRTMHHYIKEFKHNELANQVVRGINGFEWKMPSTTYRYFSTPRNQNYKKSLHWEVSGVNENGVGVSATLSCYPSKEALYADPFVTTGLSEDNIAQIVAATATSAKNGIETIANICKTIGSAEANAIMITDKNETWYMEMYTGHQYVAIKMPDDKACTIGNEFMLDTIAELNLKSGDYIVSDNLLSLATDPSYNFAEWDDTRLKTVEHLHLYKSYAGYGELATRTKGGFGDGCHMRTWIGQFRFVETPQPYSTDGTTCANIKYPAFFTPKASYQNGKLSEADVISFMRDRFECVLEDLPATDNNRKYFEHVQATAPSGLRVVGVENAYQVHVISVDPNLPAEISTTELMCLSNSNYAPFIPFNNGITSFTNEYTLLTPEYTYSDDTASQIYKRLNALAAVNRTNYGLPIVPYIEEHEQAWTAQYYDLLNQAKDKSIDDAKNAITNFCKSLQTQGLTMAKTLFNDLLFHIENTIVGVDPKFAKFEPLVNLEYYANLYGWTYKREDKKATLTSGSDILTFDLDYQWDPDAGKYYGKVKKGDTETKILMHINNGIPYVEHGVVKNYVAAAGHEIVKVNINDYIINNKFNHLVWIIPSLIGVMLISGLVVILVVNKKQNKIVKKN